MRLLLDESLPRPLADLLVGHGCSYGSSNGLGLLGQRCTLTTSRRRIPRGPHRRPKHRIPAEPQDASHRRRCSGRRQQPPRISRAPGRRCSSSAPHSPTKDPGAGRRLTFRAHARAAWGVQKRLRKITMSHLASLNSDLDGVRRAINRTKTCPREIRPKRESQALWLAKEVYGGHGGLQAAYSASTLATTRPRPGPPENASVEWYYYESRIMLEEIRLQALREQ